MNDIKSSVYDQKVELLLRLIPSCEVLGENELEVLFCLKIMPFLYKKLLRGPIVC